MVIRVALDWTPNVVHLPLLIAQSQGFYRDAGIEVQFINPQDDGYKVTPARKVLNGAADLAICPSESVIAYAESQIEMKQDARLQAVYAMLDKDASSILCSRESGVTRAKDLDGKVYGSYNARYEDDIIRAMICNDGGEGSVRINDNAAKLDLFSNLTSAGIDLIHGRIDATWIFSPWEGLKASRFPHFSGHELKLAAYGVPYGYSPVLARSTQHALSDDDLTKFLAATTKGYAFASEHHDDAVKCLQAYCPDEETEFLSASIKDIQQYWATEHFGTMQRKKWDDFIAFLQEKSLLKVNLRASDLFVNL